MITQEELKEVMNYDPHTGIFIREKKAVNVPNVKNIVGTRKKASGKTYLLTKVKGIQYYLHRLAWLYVFGNFPDRDIDHINGNSSDNRIINLREVTKLENSKNRRLASNNKSGVSGVSWNKKTRKWHTSIRVDNKRCFLGCFDSIFDAACVKKTAEKIHGFHKNHGGNRPL